MSNATLVTTVFNFFFTLILLRELLALLIFNYLNFMPNSGTEEICL